MGAMSSSDCEHFRGLMALHAIGMTTESQRVGLGAHLEGCGDCREDDRGLEGLSTWLSHADLGRLEEQEMPAGLPDAVLGHLRVEANRERRTRRLRYVIGAGAAAAVLALGLALTVVSGGAGGSGTTRTVALTGEPGVRASVQLTSEAWGTSLRIDEAGQPGDQVLWVSMRTKSGAWWAAGTYRTVSGRPAQVDLACALGMNDIRSVWIKDSTGHTVLHAYVD